MGRIVLAWAVGWIGLWGAAAQAGKPVGEPSVAHYQDRYRLSDAFMKLVNNRGDGFEPLYGVRNFRAVLNGVVYRGGANNKYNRYGVRSNSNPLPNVGLRHLCEEGFSTAVYLYSDHFETAPELTKCESMGAAHRLTYLQHSPLASDQAALKILNLVHKRLTSVTDQRPLYLHCWNGWHASGFISALTLRQFCGWSASQAVAYWDRNTDGNNREPAYDRIRARIRAFQPRPEWAVPETVRRQVCPAAEPATMD